MQIAFTLLTVLLFVLFFMSLAAFGVHLMRSVRAFRAGYRGEDYYLA